ncbi:MAG: manganese catalase family protein [Bacilli bacterium]
MEHNEHIRPGYSSQELYPPIKVQSKNKYYAEILMNDYAGIVSEMSAINQYLYAYFISDTNKEIAELFENISITEMLHLEILAKLITLLGEKPVYRGGYNTNNYWSGKYIFYKDNIKNQLEYSIETEKKAIQNYLNDINLIKDRYIQDVLKRIILDEEVHIKLFEQSLNKYI